MDGDKMCVIDPTDEVLDVLLLSLERGKPGSESMTNVGAIDVYSAAIAFPVMATHKILLDLWIDV